LEKHRYRWEGNIKMTLKSGGQFLLLYGKGERRMNTYEAKVDRYSQRKDPNNHNLKKCPLANLSTTNYTRNGLRKNLDLHHGRPVSRNLILPWFINV
jgi:hypothetical protein